MSNDAFRSTLPNIKFLSIDHDWLALSQEEVVEPELEIIDPHHHLWDGKLGRYLLDDFLSDAQAGHRIRASVYAECHSMYRSTGPAEFQPVGETEYVAEIASRCARDDHAVKVAAGIVGAIDLALGRRSAAVLDAHIEAGGGRLKGIRGATAWHEDELIRNQPTTAHMLMQPLVREAIAEIAARDLSLDIWCFHTQLPDVLDLSRSLPALRVVIDHGGGPVSIGPYQGRRREVFAEWRKHLAQLGALPNVYMKIGGFGMRYSGFDFHERPRPPSSDDLAAAWRPYVEACIECFGPGRCMFESNFPADKPMASYRAVWNAFKKLSAPFSAEERRRLFYATANEAYRLAL